jgi:hypothetical protein
MTISREQHAQRNAIRSGIIAAMRDNLDDEFTAAEICDAMTAPIDRHPRIVGANLKSMASEGLVETRPRQNIHVYRLLPAALDWRPPVFHRAPKANPGYQRPTSPPEPSPALPPPAHVNYTLPAATLTSTGTPAMAQCAIRGTPTWQAALEALRDGLAEPDVPETQTSLLPTESREDEAPTPPASQPTAEDSSGVHPPYLLRAELDQVWPTDRFSETRQASRPAAAIADYSALQPPFAWLLAEPDQPLEPDQTPESPQPSQEAATDIHLTPLPVRWLPELRLRLLGYDDRGDPVITLRINTEGHGAYLTLSTHGQIPFDPGELDFLPSIGTALCQFVDALYPYGIKPGAK